jgi:hypothetical protein
LFDEEIPVPMIDVYSAEGTFADKHALAKALAQAARSQLAAIADRGPHGDEG